MSIASELQNYADGLDDAYDAVNDMSGIIPQHKNMNNLDQAIRTIPQNTGTTYTAGTGIDITNDIISIDNTVVPEFSDLATVATTGDYGDLLNTPTIPTNTSDLTNDGDDGVHPFLATDDVATVATSGLYSDLTGTPTIPTKTSDLVNDGADNTSTYVEADELAAVATSGSYNDLLNKPTIPAAQVNSDWNSNSGVSQILNKPTLATVATSGSYNDLLNTPTIPAAQVNSDWDAASGVAQILNKPTLATVATSGSYTDLIDKPTIPEPMTVYVDASFSTPSTITGVFSDSALTTPADPDDMADTISAGNTVVVIYDGGQSQELIELSSVNSNSRFPEVGQAFTSAISTSAIFSAPTVVILLYDGNSGSWSVETVVVPTKTSDITNDGSDGTSTYVEADDLATVATTGDYNDLSNLPSDRLFSMLIPDGTEIPANKDLNTLEFLSVGKYFCQPNTTVATLTNCPTTSAFMMEVSSPLSTTVDDETTDTWVYRLRKLTTFTGEVYYQQVNSGSTAGTFTYQAWKKYLYNSVGTSQIDNSAVTEAKIAQAFKDKLFFKSGDVLQNSSSASPGIINLVGCVTSGNKDFLLTMPVQKSLANITSATINKMKGYARCHGAYLTNLSNGDAVAQATSVTVTVDKVANCINMCFNRSGGWGATNNSVASMQVNDYKITLS